MQLLAVDIGTGTQDILLFNTSLHPENGYKLVTPSPTMLVRNQMQSATKLGEDLLLTGVTMGGGPILWAAQDHLRAGYRIFATPFAARTFNDDLDWVQRQMGVTIISPEEVSTFAKARKIELADFDYTRIHSACTTMGIDLQPQGVAVAVFDHGAAPPGVSDRQFRFDYLQRRISEANRLTAFAYLASNVPAILTRMHGVVASANELPCPLVVMDSAPAAVLGAMLDPHVASQERSLVANVGNFHTLAFRLGPSGIEGLFEHHTGLLDRPRLEALITALSDGTLTSEEVFMDQGHGAMIRCREPYPLLQSDHGLAVTGPRRSLMLGSRLRPYFAVPFGDMMLSGCFGLLLATAELLPDLAGPIRQSLAGRSPSKAPWEAPST